MKEAERGELIIPNPPSALVEDVAEAINSSNAIKIHVCNLMTKPAESNEFKASDFVRLLLEYLGTDEPLDYLVVNSTPFPDPLLQRYAADGQYPVELDEDNCRSLVNEVLFRPVLAAGVYLRHDPDALAKIIMHAVASNTPQNTNI